MKLTSPHFRDKPGPTPLHVRRAFHKVARAGPDDSPFLILEDACGYIQTMREDDGYHVEVRDASTGRHYATAGHVRPKQAYRLFVAFLHGGLTVLALPGWRDVTEAVRREIAELHGPDEPAADA